MKRILCYGDSNTWGYNPATKKKYERDDCWTAILRKNISSDYLVIKEGLSGRTTVWEDPIEGYKSGKEYLIPCLESHKPLDLVVIMLGTNDLKKRFSLSAYDIAQGAGVLVDMVQKSETGLEENAPEVLLLGPPPVYEMGEFSQMFAGAEEKSRGFPTAYKQVAGERQCYYLDTSTVIESSKIDGIHLTKENHEKLGKAVAEEVKKIL